MGPTFDCPLALIDRPILGPDHFWRWFRGASSWRLGWLFGYLRKSDERPGRLQAPVFRGRSGRRRCLGYWPNRRGCRWNRALRRVYPLLLRFLARRLFSLVLEVAGDRARQCSRTAHE